MELRIPNNMELQDVKKTEQRFYNLKEVAAFIGVSVPTVYRMVKYGKLKAVNIAKTGNRPIWGFRAEDIQSYYDQLPHASRGLESIDK